MLAKEMMIGWVSAILAHIPSVWMSSLSLCVNCLKLDQDCCTLRRFSYPLARVVIELRMCFRNSLFLGICLVSEPILASWPGGREIWRVRSHPSLLLLHPLNLVMLNFLVQSLHSQDQKDRLVETFKEIPAKTAEILFSSSQLANLFLNTSFNCSSDFFQ